MTTAIARLQTDPRDRRQLAAGDRRADIARRFGVTSPQIGHIKFGRCWTHIPE